MVKSDRKKKVINVIRAPESVINVSIFSDEKVAELDDLKSHTVDIFEKEILPLRNETREIQGTVKTFRKTDVDRIEAIMELMKKSIINLVVDKGYKLQHILEFPYKMECSPKRAISSESDISDSEFVRPDVLTEPWFRHLTEGDYWQNQIESDKDEEEYFQETERGEKEFIDVEEHDSKKEKLSCKKLDMFLPPKLVVGSLGQTSCKHLRSRLIYFDEPFEMTKKIKKKRSTARNTKKQ